MPSHSCNVSWSASTISESALRCRCTQPLTCTSQQREPVSQRRPRDRAESGEPRQARFEAPPYRGCQEHAAWAVADRSNPQRQSHAGSHARHGAWHAHGSACSPAAQTRQAARGQGLQSSPVSVRVPRYAASRHGSLGLGSRAASIWDATAASSSAPSRGCLTSVPSTSVTSAAPTYTCPKDTRLCPHPRTRTNRSRP